MHSFDKKKNDAYSTKLLCASPWDNTHEASVLDAKVYIKV